MTIAISTRPCLEPAVDTALTRPVRPRRRLRRALVVAACVLTVVIALVGSWIGITFYRIDHAVHHVTIPAALLARGKNDLLAIVKGPGPSEQAFVFHAAGDHTHVLQIPSALALPLADGARVPLENLSLRTPTSIVAGLDRLGIPVGRYVGVDLRGVDLTSTLGRLATGKISIASLVSDPTGTTTLLEDVASHTYLGPGTPVSSVLSLMGVPTSHPVSVPTERNGQGDVVLASEFANVLRGFL